MACLVIFYTLKIVLGGKGDGSSKQIKIEKHSVKCWLFQVIWQCS